MKTQSHEVGLRLPTRALSSKQLWVTLAIRALDLSLRAFECNLLLTS